MAIFGVKRVGFRSQNRMPAYSRFLASLPFLMALACTGSIGDEHSGGSNAPSASSSGGGTPGGAGSGAGTPGSGAATGPAGSGMGTGPVVIQPAASSRFVRLNHQQWENSVRDALRLTAPVGLSKTFVAEPLLSTFDNNGSVLSVSADLWHDYENAAEAVANKVARDAKLLAAIAPTTPTDPAGKAKAFVQSVGARVLRRPLTDAEVTRYVGLFNQGPTLIGSADAFADGVELVLTALLQSPFFIYRTELGTAAAGAEIRLGDYEVASKLSYALTNSMPDDALFTAAAAKQLETPGGVMQEATRVLTLTAAADTIGDFHNQLLRMRDYDAVIKDVTKFPLFSPGFAADMKQETLSFIKNVIIDQGRSYSELLTAPYSFANSRIAQLYGLSARTPSAGQPDPFVRVDLNPQQRAGFLTQLGFLAANGVGSTPNIIIRGVHIAKDLLCVDLPPPPNIIPPIPTPMPNSTNRQRIDALTAGSPCNGCHTTRINPLGFAFESLDGVGAFRTTDNGLPINTAASYTLDGQTVNFTGAVELVKAIAASQQGHECYARRLIEYLYARAVDPSTSADQALITQAGSLSKNNMSVKNLIANLVTSDAFLARLP